jgi:hypothetical protein
VGEGIFDFRFSMFDCYNLPLYMVINATACVRPIENRNSKIENRIIPVRSASADTAALAANG